MEQRENKEWEKDALESGWFVKVGRRVLPRGKFLREGAPIDWGNINWKEELRLLLKFTLGFMAMWLFVWVLLLRSNGWRWKETPFFPWNTPSTENHYIEDYPDHETCYPQTC